MNNLRYAFLSIECESTGLADVEIMASSREEARVELKRRFESIGLKAELSETSDEVIITMENGTEAVYYGFDEN